VRNSCWKRIIRLRSKILNYSALQIEKLKTREGILNFLNLSVPVLMGIFIFFNPFPHTTAIKEICFYSSFFIVLLLIYFKKIDFSFKSPLTLPFALFVIWVFIGLFFALDKEGSVGDFRAHLLKYMVIYYILINFFNSRKRLVGLSWIIIISATIFSIGGIYYFYVKLGHPLSAKFLLGLPEIPVNLIGITTVCALVLSLHHSLSNENLYNKAVSLVCVVPLFFVTFLTQTRSTLVAVILASIVLLFNRRKVMVIFFGMILIVAIMTPVKNRFIHPNIITSLRLGINYTTLEVIKDFPIIGTGFGMETFRNGKLINLNMYNKRVPEKYKQKSIHNDPHSMLPSIAARTGLVGLAFFFYIVFAFLKMSWNCIRHGKEDFIRNWGRCVTAMFVVVFFIGIFEPVLSHHPETVFYTILAMMTILWRINQEVS